MGKNGRGRTKTKEQEGKLWEELLRQARQEPVPELYFATVRAIGTPVGPVHDALERSLQDASYLLGTLRVSKALDRPEWIGVHARKKGGAKEPEQRRYKRLGDAAVDLRERAKRRDAVAIAAIERLHTRKRPKFKNKSRKVRAKGTAFLFRNLMHHEEVGRLRKLYDRQFFIISIYSPRPDRQENLAESLGDGHRHAGDSLAAKARKLIDREENFFRRSRRYDPDLASRRKFVTNIPKAFQYGDLFVDAADPKIEDHIDRFVGLIFGYPYHTPTMDEIGMSDAFSAALQSGNLARQVGAAICTEEGDLLTTGTNDVPKPGGGIYRSDDEPDDYRDHNLTPRLRQYRRGFDISDPSRRRMLEDLVHRMLADPDWLRVVEKSLPNSRGACEDLAEVLLASAGKKNGPAQRKIDYEAVVDTLIRSDLVWGAQLFDVLEYGRTLHAEMDAITSAARKGVSVRDATLYCTTLPCHECARLIVGAGIRRVIFIEPYEKSRSEVLFDSEIRFTTLTRSRHDGSRGDKDFVDFVPYVGVSPRRFSELFAKGDRKRADQPKQQRTLSGERAKWKKSKGQVRESIVSERAIAEPRRLADILDHERLLIKELRTALGQE